MALPGSGSAGPSASLPTAADASSAGPSRRAVVGAAAWAAPAITILGAAPAFAVSGASVTVPTATGLIGAGTGAIYLSFSPAPTTAPAPAVTFSDRGATAGTLRAVGVSGGAAVYRLPFSTTTSPVPPAITVTVSVPGYGIATTSVTMSVGGTHDARLGLQLDGPVNALARQADGRLVVGGAFASASGQTRRGVLRLTRDGVLDLPDPAIVGEVLAVAVQADGRILVAGSITSVAGQPRQWLARLTVDGSLDTSFVPASLPGLARAVVAAPDGTVYVGGEIAGDPVQGYVARLTSSGAASPAFTRPALDGAVHALALVPRPGAEPAVMVGGDFAEADGTSVSRLFRLLPDGSRDPGFGDAGVTGPVHAVAVLRGGGVVAVGDFTIVSSYNMSGIARYDSSGMLDDRLDSAGLGQVGRTAVGRAVLVQPDGGVVVAGDFNGVLDSQMETRPRSFVARIRLDDGLEVDATFVDAGLDAEARALALDEDGLITVGGAFTQVGVSPRPIRAAQRIVRLFG
ncbi:delta-60 repeat domain-containing protein [Nocardioides sp. TRM66260-LWL]|uniref:delta-60 repeat domain-containing protein n=1 Tax=Nocardioides sp. TRM66260-LWL TaxID=2874478 RepID=UPI001CC3FA65|nr:delta-60 repeat domain-containing protein [Nocardioides sp. TRM66260-LWL]MBZ5734964.1 delta-60 repeat domain-containing protein [Nocardioides sp. TRM66260-LWL]